MHNHLTAIGFPKLMTLKEHRSLIKDIQNDAKMYKTLTIEPGLNFCELRQEYSKSTGMSVYGEIEDDQGVFEKEYCMPYFRGSGITSYADVLLEKWPDRNAFLGICEDAKVEVSLIFHVQNVFDFIIGEWADQIPKTNTSVTLSGLANEGMILLPVKKSPEQERSRKEESRNRMMLLSAAREGDSDAMESLTLEDIDTYSKVSRRLVTEDVFSIVESYFMPYGVQCDHYAIMGEILAVHVEENILSKNKIYTLSLDVNELQFDVCVPADGLVGEPVKGRRFKGNIWLQGYINF